MAEMLLHQDLSGQIIGAAMTVLNQLKSGLDEKPYENAVVIELLSQGHKLVQQRRFPVHYQGHLIGTLVPDLIVDGLVIVDPKVVTAFNENHIAQMISYLAITGLDLAILLNFKFAKSCWKQIAHTAHPVPEICIDPEFS